MAVSLTKTTDIERIRTFVAVRRAARPARRAAFSLALPLVAFLVIAFVAPILYLLVTAVGNPETRSVLPQTLVVLQAWDGNDWYTIEAQLSKDRSGANWVYTFTPVTASRIRVFITEFSRSRTAVREMRIFPEPVVRAAQEADATP